LGLKKLKNSDPGKADPKYAASFGECSRDAALLFVTGADYFTLRNGLAAGGEKPVKM
jgi:hypothetical protein